MILEFILAIIFVEAVTEIVVASEIAQPMKAWLWNLNEWLGKLVNCGYCTSVWVAASVGWIFPLGTPHPVVDFLLATFVLHRLSNVWHEGVTRWLNRAPLSFHLMKTERIEYAEQQPILTESEQPPAQEDSEISRED